MQITGNTIFIPGGTRGIGAALAVRLADRGNTVIVGGRRPDAAPAHPRIHAVAIDTSDAASIERTSAEVIEAHPEVNVLIAMAGIMRAEDWTRRDGFLATAEEIVTMNVLGPIRLIAGFIEHLRAQDDATIMTVSSGLAFAPLRVTPTYNASKAAMHMLSESLRLQLAGTSVRVQELVPPAVQTDLMPGHAENPTAMPLDAFADEVISLIEADPEAHEIQVERVGFLRYGEARGDYAQVVQALNASDPHARVR